MSETPICVCRFSTENVFIRRRLDTVSVVQVKGHAAEFFNNIGNYLADTVADFRQLRQLGSVISARRPLVRARCRRYPIYVGHLPGFVAPCHGCAAWWAWPLCALSPSAGSNAAMVSPLDARESGNPAVVSASPQKSVDGLLAGTLPPSVLHCCSCWVS